MIYVQNNSVSINKLFLPRATRRQSLSEIGFGRIDTYTKLDKLGEVKLIIIIVYVRVFN